MDNARAELLEKVWQAIIRQKRTLTARIVEHRAALRQPGSNVHKIVAEIEVMEIKLALLDELVAEGAS